MTQDTPAIAALVLGTGFAVAALSVLLAVWRNRVPLWFIPWWAARALSTAEADEQREEARLWGVVCGVALSAFAWSLIQTALMR
ncbi:MAG TPA: hypothetical protein VM490_24675 [Armatimonadaceae bacterium]|nr:hypothetical protein [Armatimonadaceae bacterium]